MQKDNLNFLYRSDYLEEILEHFHDGIYITDNEANTVYLNHSYERISGLNVADMLGKNMKELVENGVISMSGTLKVLASGDEVTMEQSFSTGRRAIITSTPIFRAGSGISEGAGTAEDMIMVVTIVREITELYSAMKELRIQEQLKLKYQSELEKLKKEYNGQREIIAEAGSSRTLMRMVDHVRLVDAPLLLTGEKGSGKRLLASYIHEYSKRAGYSFLRINFAAIPKDDPAGYLFGRTDHEGRYQPGMLESVRDGTLYMEDLAEMPSSIQDRMLSLIRDGQCVMGDGTVKRLNIRMIAGSKSSLPEMRRMKKVSPDILYAFSVFELTVPPLKERKDDIVPLADLFLERCNRERGSHVRITKEGYERLMAYNWPENVLELENMITRAAIICQDDWIHEDDLFIPEKAPGMNEHTKPGVPEELPPSMDLREEVAALEAAYMNRAFAIYGNIRDTADYLGIDASTFTRKRQKYKQMGLM